jgi:two-component system phosphate regulon response regulator PhoB
MDINSEEKAPGGNGQESLVFVVEDDTDISRLIEHNLRSASFAVQLFSSGGQVVAEALRGNPSLFLLDIMLPGVTGYEICRQIRQIDRLTKTPVIFLTARTAEEDRVRGFELGADDYIVKPFSPRELVARVRTMLKTRLLASTPTSIHVGDLEIDPLSMTIRVQDRVVPTTVREFRLLEYLVNHRGRVFTRDQLLDAVWRETSWVTPRSVDVYVRRLREKIEQDPHHPRYLKTLRGIGYRFENVR